MYLKIGNRAQAIENWEVARKINFNIFKNEKHHHVARIDKKIEQN